MLHHLKINPFTTKPSPTGYTGID